MARTLKIELDLDSKGFTAKITDAAGGVRSFRTATETAAKSAQKMDRKMHGLLATTRDLTLVLSQARTALYNIRTVATGWLETIVKTNIEMERMTYLLANMSDATSGAERFREAGENLDYLFTTAKSAPFSINALTDSFVKMKSVGIDPTSGSLNSLTDAVAAFGGSDDVLHRASIAIQQMGGKGVISMEELRQQLGEAVPSAVVLMARSMGLTYRELVDKISKGQVEASSALGKMFDEFERTFGGSAERLMDSFGGKVSVLKTELISLATTVGGLDASTGGFSEGSFMATLRDQLDRVLQVVSSPEMKVFATRLGNDLTKVVNVTANAITTVAKFGDVIISAGKALLLYFGSRAVIATVMGLTSAFNAAFVAAGSLTTGLRSIQEFSILGADAMSRFRSGTLGGAQAARDLKFALSGAVKGIGAMLGPIGFFVTAAFFAADAMGFFKDRSEEARRVVAEFNDELYSARGLETMHERVVAIDEELKSLRDSLEVYASGVPGASDILPDADDIIEKIKNLDAERETLMLAIEKGTDEVFKQRVDRDFQIISDEIGRQTAAISAKYKEAQIEIDQSIKAVAENEKLSETERNKQREELEAQRIANLNKYYADEIKLYEDYANQLVAQGAALKDGADLKDFNQEFFGNSKTVSEAIERISASYENLQQRLTDLKATQAEKTARASAANNFIITPKEDEAVTKFTNKIDTLQQRADSLRARLNDTGSEIAKVNALISQRQAAGELISEEDIERARKYANEIDTLNQKIKDKANDERITARLEGELERAKNSANALSQVLTGGMSGAEAEASRFHTRMVQIANGMVNNKDKALELADAVNQAFLNERGLDFALGLREQTVEIQNGLLTTQAAKDAAYQADLRRIDEYIATAQYSGEQEKQIAKIVADYKQALLDKYVHDSRSGTEVMLEGWLDTTTAMDQAQQQWLDSFASGLASGQLNFADFTESILEDIARIIIRAQIANAIISAISAFTGGSSAPATDLQGPVAGPLTGIYHSGGVVGKTKGQTRAVDPSIFAYAKRYHSGGYPGLKENEVPAILEKGERVMTEQEQRAMGSKGGTNVEVNIYNESGQEMQEQSRSGRFDGETYILDIVTAAAGRPGKMRNAIKDAASN